MRRIFAEIDDREANIWGYDCPHCKQYQDLQAPAQVAMATRCADCRHEFIVSFSQYKANAI